MTEQDRVFQQTARVEDFAFDERVAKVFDNMVSRSVPFYNEVQRIQSDLIMDFLPEEAGVVFDSLFINLDFFNRLFYGSFFGGNIYGLYFKFWHVF